MDALHPPHVRDLLCIVQGLDGGQVQAWSGLECLGRLDQQLEPEASLGMQNHWSPGESSFHAAQKKRAVLVLILTDMNTYGAQLKCAIILLFYEVSNRNKVYYIINTN